MEKNLKETEMIIAMACTKNWYHYLMVDIYSLLECTKNVKKIYLLIETTDINEVPYLKEIKEKYNIEFKLINLNDYLISNLNENSPNRDTIYSNFSFGRLLLPDIVEEDKVLYIDTDAIVRKDISNVWKYDISNYYVAGIRDYGIIADNIINIYGIYGKYINSGFVVFNLKKIREKKHIDAKTLAHITGIDAANLCRIEQGKQSVGIDILSKIANSMGYKIDFVELNKT